MKYNGFYDQDHMRMYLRRSVIRLGDEPIFIMEVERVRNKAGKRVLKLVYRILGELRDRRVTVKSKRINFEPVSLGFINYHDGFRDNCVIASRIPSRMWKIGLSQNNLNLTVCAGQRKHNTHVEIMIQSRELGQTIKNNYPSYAETLYRIEGPGELYSTVAFHRHFAIQKRHKTITLLYYKFNIPVGIIKNRRPELRRPFEFLKEHLEGAI